MWTDLLEGDQQHYVMTAGSGDSCAGADLLGSIGLVGSHAYSLIACAEVTDRTGKPWKLVHLRNPWGQGEWTGDWSDKSPLWTPDLKKKLALKDHDDGAFWMSFHDFCEYFTDVQICRVHDDFKYAVKRVTGDGVHGIFFKVTIKKSGDYYLTVNQESKRKYVPEEWQYSLTKIVFGKKLDGGKYEYVEGFARADKEVWTEGILEPGEYIVYTKADWPDNKPRDYTIGIYGACEAFIEKISKSSVPNFLENVYCSKARTSPKLIDYGTSGVKDCKKATELTDDGFGYFYWRNNSNRTLEEELYLKTFDGLRLRKPYSGNTVKVVVKPGEEKIVLYKTVSGAKSIRLGLSTKTMFK